MPPLSMPLSADQRLNSVAVIFRDGLLDVLPLIDKFVPFGERPACLPTLRAAIDYADGSREDPPTITQTPTEGDQ